MPFPSFSARTGWNREPSPLSLAVETRRAQGLPILDLTASNPARCGLGPSRGTILAPLGNAGADYDPQPFGSLAAREAVAAYYRPPVDPSRICLTASTSEAYSFLFRLLCDPGDEVLIASPSYPLFEYLGALDDVRLVSYPLFYDHGWQIEPGALEARIGPRTRAIVLVHPNNPTGHFVSDAERAELEQLCAERGLALIVDEVFLDYAWDGQPRRSFTEGPHPALTFVLSGLSKVCALPQMKLSWCVVSGPSPAREEALGRLEIIADAFLSVSALPQIGVETWLETRGSTQGDILRRMIHNLHVLDEEIKGSTVNRLGGEGGWYVILRAPTLGSDESWAMQLLNRTGVLVHPGSAFGFPEQGWIIVSLLQRPQVMVEGIKAIISSAPSQPRIPRRNGLRSRSVASVVSEP